MAEQGPPGHPGVGSGAMTIALKLAVMLVAGLVARHATLRLGRQLAARTRVRVPVLCAYATAGTLAGLAKLALSASGELPAALVWLLFGALWGVIVGLLAPLDRRPAAPRASL
jgi:hypothetical protein